jgi:hypothetical protein
VEITQMAPEGRTDGCPPGAQAIVGGATAPHAPEALNDMQLRARAREPLPAQLRRGRSDRLHPRSTRPRGMVNRAADLGRRGRWRQAGASLERGGQGAWQPRRLAGARREGAAGGRLQQAGGPWAGHQLERGHTIDLLLVLPRPPQGPVALHAQGGGERRPQRTTCCIWAQPPTRPRLRFFVHAASAPCAPCCGAGSPRRERYVGREGRMAWR